MNNWQNDFMDLFSKEQAIAILQDEEEQEEFIGPWNFIKSCLGFFCFFCRYHIVESVLYSTLIPRFFSVIVKAVYFFTNTNLPVKYVQPQKRKEKQKKTKQDKAKNTTEYD